MMTCKENMNTHLCDFTTLTESQKVMILKWRNHEDVRAYMYNEKEIGKEEHFNFIESLKKREDRRYFLVQKEDENIGVVDFNDISKHSATLGLYSNPNLTQKGIGSILLQTIVDYAFYVLKVQTLQAEVFATNEKAKALYEKFGFHVTGQKSVKGKEVICMELRDENRSF
ncbi:MAG: UDP-4-amino-4,6-dideoxy-N-acetyl-beta-L-altrosamine N-acetyltransferase [Sulfurospirillaceae bacterium]|nr:UDP-4-amino-4,6-dideoxy-N-acetyl-beta-L-altrosamine N-acetyltransferase [Sulfurospirillaceae bacterium]